MLPGTEERVPSHTHAAVNARIEAETADRVRRVAASPGAIDRRLRELDQEWDVERVLEANAATLALTGVALAAFVDRRWLALPAAVAAFLLQHAVQGWCPPIPVIRRLGVRTAGEISAEKTALRAARGDFAGTERDADAAWRAAR